MRARQRRGGASSKTVRVAATLAGVLALVGLIGGAYAIADDEPTAADIFADETNEKSKEEIFAEETLLQELGEADPAPREDPEEAAPEPDPADFVWESGIFGDAEFPAGLGYTFENRWQGELDGWNVTVFAGGYLDDPTKGVLLIQLKDPATWGNKYLGPFAAPVPGPVHIEAFKGNALTIMGKDGTTISFDITSNAFS